jgi:hypothetical protein
MIVTRNELADALGLTPAKISAMQTQGVFTTVSRGKYDLSECVQKFIEISVEHLMKKQKPVMTGAEEETLQYWKMIRQKNAALKELGITMKTEDAEKLMSVRLSQIRNVLTTIDSVWAPYMIGLKTVEDSQKMLSRQLDNLFDQLSSLQDFEEEEEIISEEQIDSMDDGEEETE